MTTYKDHLKRKGFDVSKWNDNNETVYFPVFDRLVERGFSFVGIRTSVGVVKDEDFEKFYAEAQKWKLDTILYPYLDFYSHKWMKISPAEWGKRQARAVYELIRGKNFKRIYLDVENSSLAAITDANKSEVGVIINAFLQELDKLTGQVTGIYTNQGYLFVFGYSHRCRPLWFSWYNRNVTIEQIRAVLKAWKWTGVFDLLQYASDGDIDDNGTSDGRAMGLEGDFLDLNVAIDADWASSETSAPVYEDGPEVVTPAVKYVTVTIGAGVKVRSSPVQGNNQIGTLAVNQKRVVLDTAVEMRNTWVKVSEGWICAQFGNQQLAEVR